MYCDPTRVMLSIFGVITPDERVSAMRESDSRILDSRMRTSSIGGGSHVVHSSKSSLSSSDGGSTISGDEFSFVSTFSASVGGVLPCSQPSSICDEDSPASLNSRESFVRNGWEVPPAAFLAADTKSQTPFLTKAELVLLNNKVSTGCTHPWALHQGS